ncbi:MAG: hypothetical protein RL726_395 [Actinomycetota bacterium]|jgi:hypothetical protein
MSENITKRTSAVRTPEVAVGALIIAACVVGAMMWGRSAVVGTSVLVVTNDVKRGQVLEASDFGAITLTSSDDIELVRASALQDAVGLRATVDIAAGTPLTPAQLDSVDPLAVGEGLVGLTVAPGDAPADLDVGDSVRLLTVTREADGSTSPAVEASSVEVWAISEPDPLDGARVITLKMNQDVATMVLGREEIRLMKVNS